VAPADEESEEESDSPLDLLDEVGGDAVTSDVPTQLPDVNLPGDSVADPSESATDPEADPRTLTTPHPLRSVKEYFLTYEDGRWTLQNEPEEESIKRIFEYALADQ
jgi:hypothetical protein